MRSDQSTESTETRHAHHVSHVEIAPGVAFAGKRENRVRTALNRSVESPREVDPKKGKLGVGYGIYEGVAELAS
jgi:hypothetical protein